MVSLTGMLFAMLVAAAPAGAGRFNTVVDPGYPMPEFFDLPTATGGRLSSADLTEDVVVLVSMAVHCPWSKGIEPALERFARAVAGRSVRVVAFAVNQREDDRLPAIKERGGPDGFGFEFVYDGSQRLGRLLGATRTPEFFVFDRDRRLVYTGLFHDSPPYELAGEVRYPAGVPSRFYLAEAVRALTEGRSVAVAETRPYGCSVEYVK